MTVKQLYSDIVEALRDCIDKVIVINLRDKKTIEGTLQDFDQGMSLVLIDAKDTTEKDITSLGKILIRGNSILTVSLPNVPTSKNMGEASGMRDFTKFRNTRKQ